MGVDIQDTFTFPWPSMAQLRQRPSGCASAQRAGALMARPDCPRSAGAEKHALAHSVELELDCTLRLVCGRGATTSRGRQECSLVLRAPAPGFAPLCARARCQRLPGPTAEGPAHAGPSRPRSTLPAPRSGRLSAEPSRAGAASSRSASFLRLGVSDCCSAATCRPGPPADCPRLLPGCVYRTSLARRARAEVPLRRRGERFRTHCAVAHAATSRQLRSGAAGGLGAVGDGCPARAGGHAHALGLP